MFNFYLSKKYRIPKKKTVQNRTYLSIEKLKISSYISKCLILQSYSRAHKNYSFPGHQVYIKDGSTQCPVEIFPVRCVL